ncbi:MAG: helix-turn-helix transcriptional regulator [Nitrospinae bacterium]|nr:helix-turn-helix transcriptional regulator [Nitrospinota bacterium]
MKLRMKGELITKHLVERGLTLVEASRQGDFDVRTLQRAVNGHPVQLSTATAICQMLDLKPEQIIAFESESLLDSSLSAEPEHGKSKEETPAQVSARNKKGFSYLTMAACHAALHAIEETFERHGDYEPEDILIVLQELLKMYAFNLARENPSTAITVFENIHDKESIL